MLAIPRSRQGGAGLHRRSAASVLIEYRSASLRNDVSSHSLSSDSSSATSVESSDSLGKRVAPATRLQNTSTRSDSRFDLLSS